MDLIHENPFRILGLNANSTERELQKQIAKVKRYLDVGKTVHFPTDYPFLRAIERPIDLIHQASGQIEQSYKKFYYALFWFVSETSFDEIAHKKLEDNEVSSAIEIWSKKIKEEVNDKSFSAYLNLSSLYLALSFDGKRINHKMLSKGLYLKGKLLRSQSLSKLTQLLHIKSDCINSEELTVQFVDETLQWLSPYIGRSHGIKTSGVIELFSAFPSSIQKYLADKFTEEPVLEIKSRIDKCTQRRKESSLEANRFGKELYSSSKGWLDSLRETLGGDNVKYQLLANNLANEILQCSIDYYNSQSKDGNDDAHRDALLVLSFSEKIDSSGQTVDRIEESRETLEGLLEEREEEKKAEQLIAGVKTNIANITRAIESFQNSNDSIKTATNLVNRCVDDLESIGNELGRDDETYIMFCDAIANNALSMLIAVVNEMQENPKQYGLNNMLSSFTQAKELTQKLLNISGSYEVKARVRENLQTISDLKSTIEQINRKVSSQVKSQNNSGCYIATMAYGSYDHPQVLVLRQFRDNVLSQSWYGKLFIKVYYKTSPHLVSLLKGHEKSNSFIKNQLDKLIRKL
ncbi:CFI-box-CTERM domain-containing protein [Colwellia sp. BRX8-9]|uniref:CFI-box-CTERM domain-containing protein n=1 Tax=Colwellia sp. BRX8-9 TaxID=2759831 RepID=UPI0015F39BE5|nr:CFI-box-CTERM domain-containing protein [Colwellia sp. BRX8-9]MBA6348344.1 hypothetical protein [Colwellia sp. BRX8-9]